jgi:FtsP/CotA-like multicopper oxidase with cupredoxin domain
MLSRRTFLTTSAAAGLFLAAPPLHAAGRVTYRLVMAPAKQKLLGDDKPETALWCFNDTLPGPVLRARQGDMLRVDVENKLPQPTTVHWHGIRLPLAMDGVPGLSQEPIPPGGRFTYEFALPDAGTYWYHPHWGSAEQVGRGLYGALIVAERDAPPSWDREALWVLSDLRLDKEAQITQDFRQPMDLSHAGRLGNTALLNGLLAQSFSVTPGERLRLRLINTANARIFSLLFAGHRPWLVALDGHPVPPRRLGDEGTVTLGPGMRADLILDATGKPGERFMVSDGDARGRRYPLLDLTYGAQQARSPFIGRAVPPLPPNPVAEPDLAAAERLTLSMSGGAMGQLTEVSVDGKTLGLREAFQQHRVAWALNGQAHTEQHHGHGTPLFSLSLGKSYIIEVSNETMWPHPLHLHGHAFRVLSQDGQALADRPFHDTVLINPRGRAELAFKADNPGDWMLHCHILEHQAAGMMAVVRVA